MYMARGLYAYLFYVNSGEKKEKKIVIVCTTSIIADLVRTIGQEYVEVVALMGPGVDPHVYRPTAGDMQRLARADIIVYNGLHLEGKIEDIFSHMHDKTVIMLSSALSPEDLIEASFAQVYDPHLWHDVSLWKKIVLFCAAKIALQDSEHAVVYTTAAEKYAARLEKLDYDIRQMWNTVAHTKRVMVTAHDAFAYYGRAYGVLVVGLQGISTDAQVNMHDVNRVVDIIIMHDVHAIFTENCIPARTMQAVCDAVKARGHNLLLGPPLFADSLGDKVEGGATYEEMMRYNTHILVKYLQSYF
ncbi:MAG TPA: zinc ABC transporter substrate-binding protein [Candidatus Bathyarchaeia archaeon]|nr:zinc ABC transporter substrate-binding protein [Candidatus Bathyarchaeia archaeon]